MDRNICQESLTYSDCDVAVNRLDPHGSVLDYITSYFLVSQHGAACTECMQTFVYKGYDKVSVYANWRGNARNKNLLCVTSCFF